MPLPTDKVQIPRTLRKCASDFVGTHYHTSTFSIGEDTTGVFSIWRGHESLLATLCVDRPEKKPTDIFPVLDRNPSFHGGIRLGKVARHAWVPLPAFLGPDVQRPIFGWTYDHFGDVPFSSLKRGAYRPDPGSCEWGTAEVLEDSIDEVRRCLGVVIPLEKPKSSPIIPGQSVRRKLIL